MARLLAPALAVLLATSAAVADEPSPDYDPEAVQSTIKDKYMKQIFDCYYAGLRRNSDLQGKVALTLKLAKDGKVKEAKAAGFDGQVDECIAKAAKAWRFPAATVEQTVPVPFLLKPGAAVAAPADVVTKIDATVKLHYVDGLAACLPKVVVRKSKKQQKPPKAKHLTLAFTLRMDGSVRDVTAKGGDKKGNACLAKAGKDWAFPEAAGESFYQVSYDVDVTPLTK